MADITTIPDEDREEHEALSYAIAIDLGAESPSGIDLAKARDLQLVLQSMRAAASGLSADEEG